MSALQSVVLTTSSEGLPGIEIDGQAVVNVTALSIEAEASGLVVCKLAFLPSKVSAQIAGAWVKCANCGGELTLEGDLAEAEAQEAPLGRSSSMAERAVRTR